MDCKPLLNITNGIWAIAIYFIWVAQRMYDRQNRRVINEFEKIIDELRGEREKEEKDINNLERKMKDERNEYLVKRYEDHIRGVEEALDRCSFLLTRPDVLEILGSLRNIDRNVADEIENLSTNIHIDSQTQKLLSSLLKPEPVNDEDIINNLKENMIRTYLSAGLEIPPLNALNGNREPSSSDLLAEVPSQDDEAKVD